MWEVYEHHRLAKVLPKLPREILKRYEKWKDIVRVSGPEGLLRIVGFRDEALAGKWQGHRSSRLSQQYRVIYRVDDHQIQIFVLDLTAHDYRRK